MPEAEFLMSHELVDHLTKDVEVASVRAIMLARVVHRCHGLVETELKEQVTSLEKEKADLKARNRELSRKVKSLKASVARNKALVEDAEGCMSCNLDLRAELKGKDDDLKKAEDSRKKAEELAEENAKKLEDLCATLLAYIQEVKVAIVTAFVKGGAESSRVLPEADPVAFSAWLQAELG